MTNSGRLAQNYTSNDDDVDMNLFLSHFGFGLVVGFVTPVVVANPLWKSKFIYFIIKTEVQKYPLTAQAICLEYRT